jgi:hypothetical protein
MLVCLVNIYLARMIGMTGRQKKAMRAQIWRVYEQLEL